MSETKRSAPASRGTRRKGRTKAAAAGATPEVAEPKADAVEAAVAVPVAEAPLDSTSATGETPRAQAPEPRENLEPVRADEAEFSERESVERQEAEPSRGEERPPRDDFEGEDLAHVEGDEQDSLGNRDERSGNRGPGGQGGKRDREANANKAGGKPAAPEAYSFHLYFDRNVRSYIGSVLEFPEVKVTGPTKEEALRDLEGKLDAHLQGLKRKGETVPEAMFSKRYPDKLEFRISQSLHRKLDLLSRQEKVNLEQLVVEILTAAAERRTEAPRASEQQHRQKHQHPHQHGHQHQPQGNQARHQHHRRGGGRNYQDTMNNRENFMEYVRSLEKGNWRKK